MSGSWALCVDLGEARPQRRPADDVRPELEEHSEPAVLGRAARAAAATARGSQAADVGGLGEGAVRSRRSALDRWRS